MTVQNEKKIIYFKCQMEEKSLTKIPAQGPQQRTQMAGRHSGAVSRACGGSAGPHCAPRYAQESWEKR